MFLFWENDEDMDLIPNEDLFNMRMPESINFESIFKQNEQVPTIEIEKSVKENNASNVFWNQNSEENSESLNKKREGARMRSKRTRERKKKYVEELEFRIKCLEKENMKLRQELERNKDNNQEEECKTKLKPSEEVEKFPAKIEKKFYNEKSELVESKAIGFEEFFQK